MSLFDDAVARVCLDPGSSEILKKAGFGHLAPIRLSGREGDDGTALAEAERADQFADDVAALSETELTKKQVADMIRLFKFASATGEERRKVERMFPSSSSPARSTTSGRVSRPTTARRSRGRN